MWWVSFQISQIGDGGQLLFTFTYLPILRHDRIGSRVRFNYIRSYEDLASPVGLTGLLRNVIIDVRASLASTKALVPGVTIPNSEARALYRTNGITVP